MSLLLSNTSLSLALLLSLTLASATVLPTLHLVKSAARSPPPPPPTPAHRVSKDAENQIPISTLLTLATGQSYDLRVAAHKIILTRALHYKVQLRLFNDLASRNTEKRDRAIDGVSFLLHNGGRATGEDRYATGAAVVASGMLNEHTFTAIVAALIYLKSDHKKRDVASIWNNPLSPTSSSRADSSSNNTLPPSPVLPPFRPAAELRILSLLVTLLSSPHHSTPTPYTRPINLALEAGLVTSWLSTYPFPCAVWRPLDQQYNYKKIDVVSLLEDPAYGRDDPVMAKLVGIIAGTSRGSKELEAVGLKRRTSSYTEVFEGSEKHPAGGTAAAATVGGWDATTTFRPAPRGGGWDTTPPPSSSVPWGTWVDATARDGSRINGDTQEGDSHQRLPLPEDSSFVADNTAENTGAGGEHPWRQVAVPRSRSLDRTSEEESLRRRNREAVVVAERGEPLSRRSILQRRRSGGTSAIAVNSDGPTRSGGPSTGSSSAEQTRWFPWARSSSQQLETDYTPAEMPRRSNGAVDGEDIITTNNNVHDDNLTNDDANDEDEEDAASHLSFSPIDTDRENMPELESVPATAVDAAMGDMIREVVEAREERRRRGIIEW